jgi:tripartite-type tricarboxylate transporter receptor subunit TctC
LPQRSPLLPAVPTLEEAGLPGYPGRGWWGLVAPRGTPAAIVERLNSEFVKLFNDPKFKAFLDKQAVASAPTTPTGFIEFLKEDRKAAETLIRIANTKPAEYKPEK